ncbi:MAG TPA: ferritin-like domain-containing protein [Longimicrobiaceae bacterium]|nr:ferritin-like domain-containing protein [Longimicrobiaceae bacterium]
MDMEGGRGPATVSSTEILDGLNDLLRLDHDAIGAYRIAIEKLEDRDHADQIAGFLRDHERHVENLNGLIVDLGGTPENEPHATGPFKEALQRLGALAGDRGLLMAFRTNELQVRTKYDNYASKANAWPEAVKATIDRNALDEERHYRWVSDVLHGMGLGPGEETSVRAAAKLREGVTRMGDQADAVRERAAEGMDRVTGRIEDETRSNPMRMVLLTFAAGFIIGRILR